MTDQPNDLGDALSVVGTALGEMLDSVAFTIAASGALAAALAEDDERLAEVLAEFDAEQLRRILTAANTLAEHTGARLRRAERFTAKETDPR